MKGLPAAESLVNVCTETVSPAECLQPIDATSRAWRVHPCVCRPTSQHPPACLQQALAALEAADAMKRERSRRAVFVILCRGALEFGQLEGVAEALLLRARKDDHVPLLVAQARVAWRGGGGGGWRAARCCVPASACAC
jgi:hypothetical protein